MNDKNLKVCCIGAGYFSQFHYNAWARIPGASLMASVDRDLESARTTGLSAYDNIEEMFTNEAPDIIDIITAPESHLETIKATLAKGVSAIICQKPFCGGLEQARIAVELAKQANIPLIVHENFRFQPWYRIIKTRIDSGAIGEVLQASFRLRTGDGQGPDAYLDRQPYFQKMPRFLIHETAVHWVDTFRYLMGNPDFVYADLRRHNEAISGEDAGYLILGYDNGQRAMFDGNRLLDHAAENHRITLGECLVEGTTGTLELDGFGNVTERKFGEIEKRVILPAQSYEGFAGDCVHALQSHVISGLLNGTGFENEAADYLKVQEIEEALYQSNETGSRVRLG
ncbi:MAG: Gfo/Idh/MocA family oxidoreductase [Rhizobiaceae bacterium]|nr:Gfo/Idh/MocA family oxidoreductase [Rhizobiaceae bacterium]